MRLVAKVQSSAAPSAKPAPTGDAKPAASAKKAPFGMGSGFASLASKYELDSVQ